MRAQNLIKTILETTDINSTDKFSATEPATTSALSLIEDLVDKNDAALKSFFGQATAESSVTGDGDLAVILRLLFEASHISTQGAVLELLCTICKRAASSDDMELVNALSSKFAQVDATVLRMCHNRLWDCFFFDQALTRGSFIRLSTTTQSHGFLEACSE
jgi:hypothetical protein